MSQKFLEIYVSFKDRKIEKATTKLEELLKEPLRHDPRYEYKGNLLISQYEIDDSQCTLYNSSISLTSVFSLAKSTVKSKYYPWNQLVI